MNLNCLHRKKEQRKEISKQKKVFLFIFFKKYVQSCLQSYFQDNQVSYTKKPCHEPTPHPKKCLVF